MQSDYILTTFGDNQFFDEYERKINLKDWLNLEMKRTMDYRQLISQLQEALSFNHQNDCKNYHLLIGAKDQYGYFVQPRSSLITQQHTDPSVDALGFTAALLHFIMKKNIG